MAKHSPRTRTFQPLSPAEQENYIRRQLGEPEVELVNQGQHTAEGYREYLKGVSDLGLNLFSDFQGWLLETWPRWAAVKHPKVKAMAESTFALVVAEMEARGFTPDYR